MKKYKVAVVGIGVVGKKMVQVLKKRKFPAESIKVLARSARDVIVGGDTYSVRATKEDEFEGIDIALFAGTEGEKGAAVTFSKGAIEKGAVVIDNGSDYRMDPNVPLVIPEVNADDLKSHKGLIANPNCTTAVLLVVLNPIYKELGLKKMVVSSYQAVSGAGGKAINDLKAQSEKLIKGEKVTDFGSFPNVIAFNALANNWKEQEKGYSNEEWKLIKETHKILHNDKLHIVPTTVRIPAIVGHGESVYIELEKKASPEEVREILLKAPGVKIVDDRAPFKDTNCPTPIHSEDEDDVLVGRIRQDPFNEIENKLIK